LCIPVVFGNAAGAVAEDLKDIQAAEAAKVRRNPLNWLGDVRIPCGKTAQAAAFIGNLRGQINTSVSGER
jgi:hypothetical protein